MPLVVCERTKRSKAIISTRRFFPLLKNVASLDSLYPHSSIEYVFRESYAKFQTVNGYGVNRTTEEKGVESSEIIGFSVEARTWTFEVFVVEVPGRLN